VSVRVPPPVPVVATAALCALAGLRFGLTWQLPAFLVLGAVGVLLAVIDLEHRVLPNRILLPAIGAGAVLLALAAALGGGWPHLTGALVGGVVLFLVFLALALLAPAGLGMGDVKLAGLLGLYLGWLGGGVLVAGAVAGFVVQAVAALVLLAGRRIGLKGELPFGPAMLAGAALAIGWGGSLVSAFWGAAG
jgi:leader peptidase (prepilin peptidase)/N-methyltransferase